jgi:hypothetical protein
MAERTHPVLTYGRRSCFSGNLRLARTFIENAIKIADEPIMRKFLEPIGRADTLLDMREAVARISRVLTDLEALPPKVEFEFKDE